MVRICFVEVIENLHKPIPYDTITILGQDGLNCGEWLDKFSISDTLLLSLLGFPKR